MDNGEMQAVQVTIQGIQLGTELTQKGLVMLKNLVAVIISNIGNFADYKKNKSLENAKGKVKYNKLQKITKDLAFFKCNEKNVKFFLAQCKKFGVPIAEMDRYKHQEKGVVYFMYPRVNAPMMQQINEVLKRDLIRKVGKDKFDESRWNNDNGPLTQESYVKSIGADKETFIDENKQLFSDDILKFHNLKGKALEGEKKRELSEGLHNNKIKRNLTNKKYSSFSFAKKDVLAIEKNLVKIRINNNYSIVIPITLLPKPLKDKNVIPMLKTNDFTIVNNKTGEESVIKGSELAKFFNNVEKKKDTVIASVIEKTKKSSR